MSVATPPILTQPHRFTAEQYHRLVESGALAEDARVELLNGIITDMSPIGNLHSATVRLLMFHLSLLMHNGRRAVLGVQDPVQLDEWSEPQPDLWLAKYRSDFYKSGGPTPSDLLLVIEVADSSLEKDRRVKIPLYAQMNIPEVWLVDLNANTVFVHRQPGSNQYREIQVLDRRTDHIAPAAFPDHGLELSVLFPD